MSPRPKLDPAIVADDEKLGAAVDQIIAADPDLRAQQARVVEPQHRLRGLVDDDAWCAYLSLDEAATARFADALVEAPRRTTATAAQIGPTSLSAA